MSRPEEFPRLTPSGWVVPENVDKAAYFDYNEDGSIRSLVDGAGISFLRGALVSGVWVTVPSIFRLRITGTGTMQMDSRDSLGNITLAAFPLTTYSGETNKIEFPYAGDNAVAIRVTLTGTVTCEVI